MKSAFMGLAVLAATSIAASALPCPSTATIEACTVHRAYVAYLAANPPGPDQASWYVLLRAYQIALTGNGS
jgi:hypothetical protein